MELEALFAAADEDDYEDIDDTGVLPSDEVKVLKGELKDARAQARLAKREKREFREFEESASGAEARLLRHKTLADEQKRLRADLRAAENRKEELVAAAREKIDKDQSKRVIVHRLHRMLMRAYEGYLSADRDECCSAIINLQDKYGVSAKTIECSRDAAFRDMHSFLAELEYE